MLVALIESKYKLSEMISSVKRLQSGMGLLTLIFLRFISVTKLYVVLELDARS